MKENLEQEEGRLSAEEAQDMANLMQMFLDIEKGGAASKKTPEDYEHALEEIKKLKQEAKKENVLDRLFILNDRFFEGLLDFVDAAADAQGGALVEMATGVDDRQFKSAEKSPDLSREAEYIQSLDYASEKLRRLKKLAEKENKTNK